MRNPEFLSVPGEIVVSDVIRAWLLKGADEIEQIGKPVLQSGTSEVQVRIDDTIKVVVKPHGISPIDKAQETA